MKPPGRAHMGEQLQAIAERKRRELAESGGAAVGGEAEPPAGLGATMAADAPRNLRSALSGTELRAVAEIRRPPLTDQPAPILFDPRIAAQQLSGAGAAALSVYVDDPLAGSETHLVRRARRYVPLPVICWDYVVDERQILAARRDQADAISLLVGLGDDDMLQRLMAATRETGMAPVVVVRDGWELESALAAGAEVICILNHEPGSDEADLGRTERLAADLPRRTLVISAYGIATREDALRAAAAGANAALIETPVDEDTAREAIRSLRGIPTVGRGSRTGE